MPSPAPLPIPARGPERCIAFDGLKHIATGPLADVAPAVKRVLDRARHGNVVVLDARTSEPVELDTRGSVAEVARRYATAVAHAVPADPAPDPDALPAEPVARGRGRPKLGVVAREVTLLPRHWEWLSAQPGGASVALRKLVEDARRSHAATDAARVAREAAYRFLSLVASPLETFEDAARALFAGDAARFAALTADWPAEVGQHARALAAPSFATP